MGDEHVDVTEMARRRSTWKLGDRVELRRMQDDPDPIPIGTRGTVSYIGPVRMGEQQIGVEWDDGRRLMVVLPFDSIRRV